jgi:two-component system chemotaxis response regulator CheY
MAKILIVDDSITSRKMLRNILEDHGHEIISEAVNGEDGLKKYKLLHPEITTMDITMPVMDGLKSLQLILEYDQTAKVVMVTAAGQKSKILDAIKYGAAEFLAKPFEANQILSVIHKIELT